MPDVKENSVLAKPAGSGSHALADGVKETPPAVKQPATDGEDLARIHQARKGARTRGPGRSGKSRAGKRQAVLTEARVRKLAIDHADLTTAAAHLGRRYDLIALLASHRELEAAWRRGRLLRNLRRLAGQGATLHEAAHDLNMGIEDLQVMVTTDIEVANHWNEARLETALMLKSHWIERAAEGNVRAMAQVESVLRNEIAHAAMDIHSLPEAKMCEIAAVTRQTLNRWLREEAMPRNAGETTYDLPAVWIWFEGFIKKRYQGTTPQPANALRDVKAEKLALELETLKGNLLDVESVKAGVLLRERALVGALERIPEQFAAMAAGKTKQQLVPMLKSLAEDLCREFVAAVDAATQEG